MTKQTPDDLNKHFNEQIHFLRSSREAFDKGIFCEGKRIANTLQVLLHSKGRTLSLIKQLMAPDNSPFKKLQFVSTANNVTENNDCFHYGLVMFNASKAQWVPKGIKPNSSLKECSFKTWWDKEKIFIENKQTHEQKFKDREYFTRSSLIMLIANKDGGKHIDKTLPEKYYKLSRDGSLGMAGVRFSQGKITEIKFKHGPEMSSIYQIASEFLFSLKKFSLI